MTPRQICSAFALSFSALTGSAVIHLQANAPGQSPLWLADYQAAQAISRESGKPLFIAFR